MRRKLIFGLILLILGVLAYNYLYQDHRDISEETPDLITTSEAIASDFLSESILSEKKYIDKTIQISGTISEVNTADLTLDDKVFCQFTGAIKESLKIGDKLTVKGRCIGFDDLLEQVKLNECSIIKN